MEAVGIERPLGRRAKPQIVVHARRRLAVGRLANAGEPIQVSPAAHDAHFAQLAGANEITGLDDVLATAPLRPHLDDALVALGRLEHRAPFVNGLGERLLDIHILPGLAGEDGRQGVPMVGRGDEHHIHILAIEHAVEVLHRIGFPAALLLANLDPFGDPRFVHVADHDAVHLGVEEETFKVALSHAAAADQAEADLVVWARFGGADGPDKGGGETVEGDGRQTGSQGGFTQELAAGDRCHNSNS